MAFPLRFNVPPEWCDWLFVQWILLCKCLWWIWVEERIDNDNSEMNSLSNFSSYEKIPWIFQFDTPCFAIGHFYNHHWKLKSFIASDQDEVIGIRFTPPPRIVKKKKKKVLRQNIWNNFLPPTQDIGHQAMKKSDPLETEKKEHPMIAPAYCPEIISSLWYGEIEPRWRQADPSSWEDEA